MEDNINQTKLDDSSTLELSHLHFLEGDARDAFAIEFLVNNRASEQILLQQITLSYHDLITGRHLSSPPTFRYEVAIQMDTSLEQSDNVAIVGTAKEPKDEWKRPVIGLMKITKGISITMQFSFPIYLIIAPREQGLIRLIIRQPQLISKARSYLEEPSSILKELQIWTERQGNFQIRLEGNWEKPAVKNMNDDRFLKYITQIDMQSDGTLSEKSPQSQSNIMFVDTRGGPFINGDVTSGGDFVGRDKSG